MVDLLKFPLPETYTGKTWDGLTWAITAVDVDETEYSAVLSSARFQFQDADGAVALTLSSATSGEVTLNTTTADAWSVTVEPRILTLTAGTYTYGLETTDADGREKPRMAGTIVVKTDPVI